MTDNIGPRLSWPYYLSYRLIFYGLAAFVPHESGWLKSEGLGAIAIKLAIRRRWIPHFCILPFVNFRRLFYRISPIMIPSYYFTFTPPCEKNFLLYFQLSTAQLFWPAGPAFLSLPFHTFPTFHTFHTSLSFPSHLLTILGANAAQEKVRKYSIT